MTIRQRIETQFAGLAFARPLFYQYPIGLRFELSAGESVLEQFLTALRKAKEICNEVFANTENITVCLRVYTWHEHNQFSYRDTLQKLKTAGVIIPKQHEIWLEPLNSQDWFDNTVPMWWLNLAFELPKKQLQNLLWCALARDFTAIQPNPGCLIYLFNLPSDLMVWAYDDRGMDVVGANKQALGALYQKFFSYLLEYDRAKMDANFASGF